MKFYLKILFLTFSSFILAGFLVVNTAQAACPDDGCPDGQTCVGGSCVDDPFVDTDDNTDDGDTRLNVDDEDEDEDDSGGSDRGTDDGDGSGRGGSSSNYGLDQVPNDLPKEDITEVVVRIVRYVIGLVGIILLVMLIYGGVMYMTSAGNEEQAKKAKQVLTYAIIGIVIIAMSFLITQFIVNALTGGSNGANDNTNTTTSTSD